jgi:hypothetical protein
MHLNAVDRHVLHAGARIARNDETRRDVRAVVVFAVGGNRQQCVQVDAVRMNDLLTGRVCAIDHPRCDRLRDRRRKAREQARFLHAQRLRDPAAL